MSHTRFRQLARLEKLAQPYIRQRWEEDANVALIHVANLSLLILYGNPKIDEPLPNAWKRCLESKAWKACREKHPHFDAYERDESRTPFDDLGETYIAEDFQYFVPDLPGTNMKDKLNAIFEIAPPWLIWFTYGDVNGRILGLKLPELSSVNRFARGEFNPHRGLPKGPFECHPLPPGVKDKFDVSSHEFKLPENLTPRERKRTLRIYESLKNIHKSGI